MRALLSPVIVPELGQVILRPGKRLLPLFHSRVLVSDVPEDLRRLPSGAIPAQSQPIAEDPRWRPFLTHERVITAAGGLDSLIYWLKQGSGCQWQGEYHHHQTVIQQRATGAIRLCWHCDNKLREQALPELDKIANRNAAVWVIESALRWLALPEGHQAAASDLSWCAVVRGVSDLLPDHAIRASLRMPATEVPHGEMRESDTVITTPPAEIIDEHIERIKPVLSLVVDEEPPAGFMLRPKFQRWECPAYLRWVKTQKCVGCGQPADDPHHIINHGMGGMGTKVHDLFVIPLCRRCHDELHRDVSAWEQAHGNQITLLVRFLDRALGIEAITTGRAK